MHAAPWFGLPSHTPVHGEPGDPAHAAPPTDTAQIGHGCVGFPVRIVAELSAKSHVASPLDRSSVPLGGAGVGAWPNVLVTHTERPEFEIGSGTPNRQPTAVQSTPACVEPDAVGPMLHKEPLQPDSVKRFVAPDGVVLSGTCERPPPSERLPQVRFFSGTVCARSRYVLPQFPEPDVDKKSNSRVVDVDVLVVVDVDDDVVVVLDVDVVVVLDVDVLEVLDVDVLVLVVDDVLVEVVDDVLLLVVVVEDVLVDVVDEVLVLVVVVDDVLVLVVVELLVEVVVVEDVDVEELDVDVVVDELVDVVLEDDVDVVVDDEELVLVLVVVGVVRKPTTSSTQFSTMPCNVAVSLVTSQSFGFTASSFATHPRVGSAPPLNFASALSTHMFAFGSVGLPGVSASWWHLSRPL